MPNAETAAVNAPPGDALAPSSADMLLIFRLEGEAFAISVSWVHEILDPQDPTPVPNAGPFSPGLINVRGVVVPVINVRHRLAMGPAKRLETTRMIVFEHPVDGVPTKLAFSADSVEDVLENDMMNIRKIPELGAIWPPEYLKGAIRNNGELVVLLDTETLFAPFSDAANT
ncbi:MAG: purine-binding chemotaxis protein CheW [Paracoccaceae bacterium]|jgi:purine-binding chemotaxis protein CheW